MFATKGTKIAVQYSKFLLLVTLLSAETANAALSDSENLAVRAYIQSKTSPLPAGGSEMVPSLAQTLAETAKRIDELKITLRAETARANRELALLQEKLKVAFAPYKKEDLRRDLEKAAQKLCCEEMAARGKPRGD